MRFDRVIPHNDGAGVIEAVSEGVTNLHLGESRLDLRSHLVQQVGYGGRIRHRTCSASCFAAKQY
jgi:NADPH:quinone reductase-like Zn-dependent oxidoreductase